MRMEQSETKDGYICVNGLPSVPHAHRLVALAFHHKPIGKDFVNHLDGNKSNNRPENLEWVTASENLVHAYQTGLRTDNYFLTLFDYMSEESLDFYSLNELARYLRHNPSSVSEYLKTRRKHLYKGRYIIAHAGESIDELRSNINQTVNKTIHAVNYDLKIQYYFESQMAAAFHFGLQKHKVFSLLNAKTEKGRVWNGWRFTYLSEEIDESIEFIKDKPKAQVVTPTRKPKPILVTNKKTGETKQWESTQSFGDSINVKKNTIQKAVLINAGDYKDYNITYLK